MAHLRLELIYRDDTGNPPRVTLGELAEFVDNARRLGACDDTELENAYDMEERESYGWRVDVDAATTGRSSEAAPPDVKLPADLTTHVFEFVSAIADGDGDARGLVEEAADMRRALLKILLGDRLILDYQANP